MGLVKNSLYLPPKTMQQAAVRATLEVLMAGISVPHCKVCGDTEKESKNVKIPTQIGDIYICVKIAIESKRICYR